MKNKWTLVWSEAALKDLKQLDKHIAKIIISNSEVALNNVSDLKEILIPLKYAKKDQYKYRIGKYRVICRLIYNHCIVEAISIGHYENILK